MDTLRATLGGAMVLLTGMGHAAPQAQQAPLPKPTLPNTPAPMAPAAQPEAPPEPSAAPAAPAAEAVPTEEPQADVTETQPQPELVAPPPTETVSRAPAPATLEPEPEPAPAGVARPPQIDAPQPKKAPGEFPFAVLVAYTPQWNTHSGYDLFDDDNVGQFWGLGATYDLMEVADSTALVVELGWATKSEDFSSALTTTAMTTHEFSAAVSAHYRMLPMVGPHLRLAAGLWRWNAKLEGDSLGEDFDDKGTEPFVRIGAGVSAEHTLGVRLAAGLLAEGGFTLARGAQMELYPVDPGEAITTRTASLGTLGLSGPYLRFAGLMRF